MSRGRAPRPAHWAGAVDRSVNPVDHRISQANPAGRAAPVGSTILWSDAHYEIRPSFSWRSLAAPYTNYVRRASARSDTDGYGEIVSAEFRQACSIHFSSVAHAVCTHRSTDFDLHRSGHRRSG